MRSHHTRLQRLETAMPEDPETKTRSNVMSRALQTFNKRELLQIEEVLAAKVEDKRTDLTPQQQEETLSRLGAAVRDVEQELKIEQEQAH